MSLKARLAAEIAQNGPISIAEYMTRCLHDPTDGYYATRPALGEGGDFITAPLVSQMFGELIGIWVIETWRGMGAPTPVMLAEVGPGDGTMMLDILKITSSAAPGFRASADLWLFEASEPLRQRQAELLKAFNCHWTRSLRELPTNAPLFLVGNEFLDCLPIRQYARTERGWSERVVGRGGGDDDLAFGLRPAPPPPGAADAPVGAVVECSPAAEAFVSEIARRIAHQGGAALMVDYGRAEPGNGDTLQALRGHANVDPLADPGAADLTAHVDFPSLLAAARAEEGVEAALLTQGEFLRGMNVEARAASLKTSRPDRAGTIDRQLARLTAPDQMGELFKAMAIWRGPTPPVFEAA